MRIRESVTIKILLTVAAAIIIAVIASGRAHADEASFINEVSNHGTPVESVTLALGHMVCGRVSADGTAGIDYVTEQAYTAGVSAHDAAIIITEAVFELCPSNTPALLAWMSGNGA